MYVHHVHAWCQWRPERGIEYPGTGKAGNCGLPRECLKLNLCSLQKQQVHLSIESLLHGLIKVPLTLFPREGFLFVCLFSFWGYMSSIATSYTAAVIITTVVHSGESSHTHREWLLKQPVSLWLHLLISCYAKHYCCS